MRLDDVDTKSEAAFETIGLEHRTRVREREHAPVQLGAKVGALREDEITKDDGLRQCPFAETVELEVIDAHVVALAQADVELHAALVDLVVEPEVVLAAEQRAADGWPSDRAADRW